MVQKSPSLKSYWNAHNIPAGAMMAPIHSQIGLGRLLVSFSHDRSCWLIRWILFSGQEYNLLFHKANLILFSRLTTIFPTILLTYGRVVTFSYGLFNFSEPGPVSHPTDKGGQFTFIPTIFQTLLSKGRPWSSSSAQNLSQSISQRLSHHHPHHICCISNLLGVIVESSC